MTLNTVAAGTGQSVAVRIGYDRQSPQGTPAEAVPDCRWRGDRKPLDVGTQRADVLQLAAGREQRVPVEGNRRRRMGTLSLETAAQENARREAGS